MIALSFLKFKLITTAELKSKLSLKNCPVNCIIEYFNV